MHRKKEMVGVNYNFGEFLTFPEIESPAFIFGRFIEKKRTCVRFSIFLHMVLFTAIHILFSETNVKTLS